jgi:hypothetical protein
MMAAHDSRSPAGAYRQQDHQIVRRGHAQDRWDERCPPGWEGYGVRAAWREAEPVWEAGGGYARLHQETGLVLIANYGFLETVAPSRASTPGMENDDE